MKKLRENLSDLFGKGVAFIKEVKNNDKVLVIHHTDVDGLVSAAILLKTFERLGLKISKVIASSNEEIGEDIRKIKDFDKTIILDIDICYLKQELTDLEKDILLIDHHPPRSNLNSEKIVYINPRLEHPEIYQPASYVLYKFLSRIVNLKDIEWLAALGTIGDYGFGDCKDLLEKWIKIRKKKELIRTVFWKNVKMLNGAIAELGFDSALQILKEADSLEALRKNEEIKEPYREFDKKLKEVEQEFWENSREIKEVGLIISEVRSKHGRVSSFFSTEVGTKHPDKIIIIMRRKNGKYSINARHEAGRVDLGKIIENCTKGMGGGGGGHRHAAGAIILAKNKSMFEERLIKELRKFSAKRS